MATCYIAQPPLYQLKKGATVRYAFSDEERDNIIKEMGGEVVQGAETSEEEDAADAEEEGNAPAEKAKKPIKYRSSAIKVWAK